jgi:hypothetical protein
MVVPSSYIELFNEEGMTNQIGIGGRYDRGLFLPWVSCRHN